MTRHFIALAALVGLAATGCTGNSEQSAEDAAVISPATSAAVGRSQADISDPTIVAIFDAANTADIETGRLAADRGSSKEVKEFGAMLVRDHTAVRQQGRDLAQRVGVTPIPPADDASARAHAEAMRTLGAKEGTEFDRAFLAHEVKFHQDVIDAMETTLLPAIDNAELKDFVTKVAPAFQAHMMAAQNLQRQLEKK